MPAAAVPWITAGIGALGLFEQSKSNSSQESLANRQFAQQQALEQAQLAQFNKEQAIAQEEDQAGVFNPAKRLSQLHNETALNLNNALSSEAQGARSLGYKPGDTSPLQTMNATRAGSQLAEEREANSITDQLAANRMAAYGDANPMALNAGIGASGQAGEFAISREQSFGDLLGSLGPYLQNILRHPQGAAVASNPMADPFINPFAGHPTSYEMYQTDANGNPISTNPVLSQYDSTSQARPTTPAFPQTPQQQTPQGPFGGLFKPGSALAANKAASPLPNLNVMQGNSTPSNGGAGGYVQHPHFVLPVPVFNQ